MCNEFYYRRVHGEWRWVRGRRPDGYPQPTDAEQNEPVGVFPDRLAPVIVKSADGEPEWRSMRWGFPPLNKPGARIITNLRNTISEATGKVSGFWGPWLKPEWRCVVPFDEFVEFTDTTPKVKHLFSVTGNEPPAFAGIWRPWSGVRGTKAAPVDGEHQLFAFLTWIPNETVRAVHEKAMPVLLDTEAKQRAWLDMSVEEALALQREPYPAERIRSRVAPPKAKNAG